MSMRASPTLIGAFVLGASVLLVAGLLLWGGTGMFKTTYRYAMYFETAVTGLQKGAPVMVRGVRIGDGTDVQVHWGTPLPAGRLARHPAAPIERTPPPRRT